MNIKDWQQGRNDGLALALKIVREGGADALEEEIKIRGITGISVNLSQKELTQALEPIKDLTIRTMLAMSVATIRDEFKFGRDRLQRFVNRFMEKTECLADGWVSWQDICQNIQEETGIQIEFRDMPVQTTTESQTENTKRKFA